MKKIVKVILPSVLSLVGYLQNAEAQIAEEIKGLATGEIHGNFQADFQYYRVDTVIGAPIVAEKILANGFSNVIYTKGNFTAGMRFESYQNALQGFDRRYVGTGVPYRFAQYKIDKLDITVGNYYEQFGTGIIFRSYEERGLGYDNAMDGIRLKYNPYKGIYMKGLIGKQRFYFDKGEGIVRGFDVEFSLNEIFDSALVNMGDIPQVILGGSAVSKYQPDKDNVYILPENVAAFSGRSNIIYKRFSFLGEFAYKVNDPSTVNNYNYNDGRALILTANYSKKGFGVSVGAKRIDNMNFRSDRTKSVNDLLINYLPAMSRQHAYNLPSSIYPYATQPNGEMGSQVELTYNAKKGTALGGKYGTFILVNYSLAYGIDTNMVNPYRYESKFTKLGPQYFSDFHIEVTKKWSKFIKTNIMYMNFIFDKDVVFGLKGYGKIYGNIVVADVTYFINQRNTLRFEAEGLFTKHDDRSWAMGMIEYTFSPSWFVAIMDQYNYDNPHIEKRVHYLYGTFGYIKGGNRFAIGYGKQRAGIFCVGGVCRNVPASNGLSLSVTSTF